MKTISITIEGVSPLLVHRFTDEAQLDATAGSRVSTAGTRGSPREQAEAALHVSASDKTTPIIPGPNVFNCIIGGGSFFKAGKSKVTTQKSSLIPACVEIHEIELPIRHKEPWMVDTRPVRIPSTGGRILRHRPCFYDWQLDFTVSLDDSIMTEQLFRQIVDAAGKRVGLGDYRPMCRGPYGRFVVISWQNGSNGDSAVVTGHGRAQ